MSAIEVAAGVVRQFEGCRLLSYRDSGGILTIGWGHTGRDVEFVQSWSQQQADTALLVDLQTAADALEKLTKTSLTDNQKGALISLGFNVGTSALAASQLMVLVNSSQWIAAAHQFIAWDHAGQAEVKGLLIRRMAEATLFLRGS